MANKPILRRKKVRLADVARVAEISVGTASMALAGSSRVSVATRRRVVEACRSLDYQPPRTSLDAQGKVHRVGLLCIGADAAMPPNSYLLHQLTRLSHQSRIRLEVASIEHASPEKLFDQVMAFAQPCDGLLVTGVISAKLMRLLDEAGLSVGTMDLPHQDDPDHLNEPCPGVVFGADDRAMAAQATNMLLEKGHRHIAFVSCVLEPNQSHHRLYEGYCLSMLNADMTPDRHMLGVVGNHRDLMRQMVQRLKRLKNPPTAAVVLDMVLVNPLMYELQAVGLKIAPKDMLIWGSTELANMYGLHDSPLMCINVEQWAQAGLSYAMSSPAARLPSGSMVYVPYHFGNCPPSSAVRIDTARSAQST